MDSGSRRRDSRVGPVQKEGVSVKGRLHLEGSLNLLAVKMVHVTGTIGKMIRRKRKTNCLKFPLPQKVTSADVLGFLLLPRFTSVKMRSECGRTLEPSA